MSEFDDAALRAAMREFIDAADRLSRVDSLDSREILDLADRKSLAAMTLRRRLEQAGWTAPVGQRATT
jgi:hypothetical protein